MRSNNEMLKTEKHKTVFNWTGDGDFVPDFREPAKILVSPIDRKDGKYDKECCALIAGTEMKGCSLAVPVLIRAHCLRRFVLRLFLV